jgi:transposase
MEVDIDTLLREGKEFFNLRAQMKKTSCPEAGTACYVINKQWIERYKKYVCYSDLIKDTRPSVEADHCAKNHPGPVDN